MTTRTRHAAYTARAAADLSRVTNWRDTWTAPVAIEHYNMEIRRQRGDLIEVYKILTGKEDMDPTRLF